MADFHEFPKMLFRQADDAEEIHGVPCEAIIVDDAEEEAAAKAEGFANSPAEAAASAEGSAPAPAQRSNSKKKGN